MLADEIQTLLRTDPSLEQISSFLGVERREGELDLTWYRKMVIALSKQRAILDLLQLHIDVHCEVRRMRVMIDGRWADREAPTAVAAQ